MKALLAARNAWSRTHSCTEMLSILRQEGMQVEDALFRDARLVDRAYVDARYPRTGGSSPEGPSALYGCETAREVMDGCDRLMAWVRWARSSEDSSSS